MRTPLAFLALAALFTAPAAAREVDRQEVAEVFATDVPQERRLYCRDTQVFTLADGREYRACVDWRAQNRTRVVRTYAALDGPETDVDANLDLARACFDIAVASQNDPHRDSFDENAFLAGARAHFELCARSRNLERRGEYSLRIYDNAVWLGGR
ncbi:hypothetical protein [Erythrobacter ani]|uniref:Uncharacterized protein n=1 Tax=Erythrobacter ani TaxID=2827235 RepID=A0ABS6SNZ6_9SPHN|nr:hypothetical protein [Erythrobacter ani]MBV7266750.1 hypothetical protein [Erythrobacter ani]